jgi:hypothetical protein
MILNQFQLREARESAQILLHKRRPPLQERNRRDLCVRVQGTMVHVYWQRRIGNRTKEIPKARATFIKSKMLWKVSWYRSNKWYGYQRCKWVPDVRSFYRLLAEDPFRTFW